MSASASRALRSRSSSDRLELLARCAPDRLEVMPQTPDAVRGQAASDALLELGHEALSNGQCLRAMEGFLRAVAAQAAGGNTSMEALLEIAAQHGIELLGPVPDQTQPAVVETSDRRADWM